jgi:hypothetical protein
MFLIYVFYKKLIFQYNKILIITIKINYNMDINMQPIKNINITPTLHLFIDKFIHTTNKIYVLKLNLEKTSKYTLQNLVSYNDDVTLDIKNGIIKCYIPFNLNLNNAEVMTTLEYKPKYNNFVLKSLTQIGKVYEHKKEEYKGFNKSIINKIRLSSVV